MEQSNHELRLRRQRLTIAREMVYSSMLTTLLVFALSAYAASRLCPIDAIPVWIAAAAGYRLGVWHLIAQLCHSVLDETAILRREFPCPSRRQYVRRCAVEAELVRRVESHSAREVLMVLAALLLLWLELYAAAVILAMLVLLQGSTAWKKIAALSAVRARVTEKLDRFCAQ